MHPAEAPKSANFQTNQVSQDAQGISLQRFYIAQQAREEAMEIVRQQLGHWEPNTIQVATEKVSKILSPHDLQQTLTQFGLTAPPNLNDPQFLLHVTLDVAKRKIELQQRLAITKNEQEARELTKLLRIARIGEEHLIAVAKTLAKNERERDS